MCDFHPDLKLIVSLMCLSAPLLAGPMEPPGPPGDMDETEHNMISLFGIPRYSTAEYTKTFFLGNNVNGALTPINFSKRRKMEVAEGTVEGNAL